jgi:hypothetical protein
MPTIHFHTFSRHWAEFSTGMLLLYFEQTVIGGVASTHTSEGAAIVPTLRERGTSLRIVD